MDIKSLLVGSRLLGMKRQWQGGIRLRSFLVGRWRTSER